MRKRILKKFHISGCRHLIFFCCISEVFFTASVAQSPPPSGNQRGSKEKVVQVAEKLKEMKLSATAKKLQDGIEETLTYMNFPPQHWSHIRTNNTIECLNREIKRCAKAIGAFLDGQSALMLVFARLRHVAGIQ